MNIELLEPQRLRISLQGDDLRLLDITFDEFDYENPRVKRVLWTLLSDASRQTGFPLGKGKLLIEVFKAFSGGCIIYFTQLELDKTKTRLKKKKLVPCMVEFEDSEEMLAAISRLKTEISVIDKSMLYLLGQHYILAIYPKIGFVGEIGGALSEYGKPVLFGEAYLAEHGKRLIKSNAIKTMSNYF